jgi:hypothetical protein
MSDHLASARTLSLLATVRAGTAATPPHTPLPSKPASRQSSLQRTQQAARSLRPTEAG